VATATETAGAMRPAFVLGHSLWRPHRSRGDQPAGRADRRRQDGCAVSQDVSPYGMFVRLPTPLPVGTVVQS
jgi:hypothetical protein